MLLSLHGRHSSLSHHHGAPGWVDRVVGWLVHGGLANKQRQKSAKIQVGGEFVEHQVDCQFASVPIANDTIRS